MKLTRYILSLVIFFTLCGLAVKVIQTSRENQALKKDYAELNHFKYGLLSVDAWKVQLSTIILTEIDRLNFTGDNKKTLKTHLERQLAILIDKIAEKVKKNNDTDSPGGFLKQAFMHSFVDIKEIKSGIPTYADAIMKELSSPRTEKEVKGILKEKIQHYIDSTFDTTNLSGKQLILNRLKVDEAQAKSLIETSIARKGKVVQELSLIMMGLLILLFVAEGFTKGPLHPFHFFTLALSLVVALAVGVTTPMIDMEAKITNLSFMLFDHPVEFSNQVLYFQSKSIMDVFHIMIVHKDLQMKLVGILMVAFSVFFPMLKMLSSFAYYFDYCQARKYRIIQFFVLKSGKWSMADVFVVAIFMAFIGFNGIINGQLKDLGSSYQEVEVFTTNGTNLQPGFYLFFAYTVLAMFLANYLKHRPYICEDVKPTRLPDMVSVEEPELHRPQEVRDREEKHPS